MLMDTADHEIQFQRSAVFILLSGYILQKGLLIVIMFWIPNITSVMKQLAQLNSELPYITP